MRRTSAKTRPEVAVTDLVNARLGIYSRASDDSDETETSVTAQEGYGERWAAKHGITQVEKYTDNDRSASWFATKDRTDFERLLADIAAGKLHIVWFWTISRSQRNLAVYVQLRDLCRRMNVRIVVKNRLYDLNDPADLRALGAGAVEAEVQSVEISENVRLGLDLVATQGRPHGPATFGFKRIYDERGKYVTQVPHEEQAPIVREIIERIAKGEHVAKLERDFDERGIPTPKGGKKWSRSVITSIASNPAYVGVRVHRGQELKHPEPCWTPLVDEETFYAAQAVLTAPGRKTTKPGRARHLLSYLALCECGEKLQCYWYKAGGRSYGCRKYHAAILADDLDDYVRLVIDEYLARPEVKTFLAQANADDSAVVLARTEAKRLRNELEQTRRAREAGSLDLDEYLRFKASLTQRIEAAEARAEAAAIPPILRVDSVDWADIPIARQTIALLAEIRLKSAGKGGKRLPVSDRVEWKWLIGPDATQIDGVSG